MSQSANAKWVSQVYICVCIGIKQSLKEYHLQLCKEIYTHLETYICSTVGINIRLWKSANVHVFKPQKILFSYTHTHMCVYMKDTWKRTLLKGGCLINLGGNEHSSMQTEEIRQKHGIF